MNKIAEYIRQIVGEVASGHVVASVISVEDYSCTVKTKLSDVEIPGVRLNASQDPEKGILIKPTKGSDVLLGALSDVDLYVSMFSEIDTVSIKIGAISVEMSSRDISLNGNQADSYLTDINKLVQHINAVKADIRALKQGLTTFVPTGTPADTAAWGASVTPWATQPLLDSSVNDIADKKVKH